MKKVAILQSNYIPWKGYFDIINMVDEFVFHDDLQYTKGDWRNRNKIKTPNGPQWLTIPCGSSEKRLICEVTLSDNSWQKDHWNKIVSNYKSAAYFKKYEDFFRKIYLETTWSNLSELNQFFIKAIAIEILEVKTEFKDSRPFDLKLQKAERVIELLKKTKGDAYLSGPLAKSYLNEEMFEREGIKLLWMDYSGYPEYRQLHPPFSHNVSIIDLVFNEGPNAKNYMKSFS